MGKPVAMCGDMAGDPLLTWVLHRPRAAQPLDGAPADPGGEVDHPRRRNIADAERLLAQALTMSTETEIEELVYGDDDRALPARAHRRRRGPAGGVSAGRQSIARPPRPARRLAVPSAALLREVDELHAALAPAYFRSGAAQRANGARLLEDGPRRVFVVEPAAGGGPVAAAVGAHLRHARRSRRWCRGGAATSRRWWSAPATAAAGSAAG